MKSSRFRLSKIAGVLVSLAAGSAAAQTVVQPAAPGPFVTYEKFRENVVAVEDKFDRTDKAVENLRIATDNAQTTANTAAMTGLVNQAAAAKAQDTANTALHHANRAQEGVNGLRREVDTVDARIDAGVNRAIGAGKSAAADAEINAKQYTNSQISKASGEIRQETAQNLQHAIKDVKAETAADLNKNVDDLNRSIIDVKVDAAAKLNKATEALKEDASLKATAARDEAITVSKGYTDTAVDKAIEQLFTDALSVPDEPYRIKNTDQRSAKESIDELKAKVNTAYDRANQANAAIDNKATIATKEVVKADHKAYHEVANAIEAKEAPSEAAQANINRLSSVGYVHSAIESASHASKAYTDNAINTLDNKIQGQLKQQDKWAKSYAAAAGAGTLAVVSAPAGGGVGAALYTVDGQSAFALGARAPIGASASINATISRSAYSTAGGVGFGYKW